MSERSERHVTTMIANGREATEARRARGSTLGGLLLNGAIRRTYGSNARGMPTVPR
jgi:hypothetical protein